MGYYDDYIEHHGILGQKWGVRRFENKNGHLTAAGKARYNTDENGEYKKLGDRVKDSAKSAATSAINSAKKSVKKEVDKHKLTDEQKAKLKKAAIITGAAVGTALAAYGGYKLYQIHAEKKLTTPPKIPISKLDLPKFQMQEGPVDAGKEISRAKELLSNKSISSTTRANIQDALKELNSTSSDKVNYKSVADLLRYENDRADHSLSVKKVVQNASKKPLSENQQLKQEYKNFVKEGVNTLKSNTASNFKTLKEELKKETNPDREVFKAVKPTVTEAAKTVASKIESKPSVTKTVQSAVNRTTIPRTEVARAVVKKTEIPRTEVKRTQVNYNDVLLKNLGAMSSMAAQTNKVNDNYNNYAYELLRNNQKKLKEIVG